MNILFGSVLEYIDIFLLVLVRVTALFVISPIFGRKNMPNIFKIGFGLMLAMIITPTLEANGILAEQHILQFVMLVFNEFCIGLILGFVSYMAFSALYVAGQIIDMQIGFGMVNVLDPQTNIQIPVIANFYFIISMMMFLALDGHHMIISSIFYSYKVLPIGEGAVTTALLDNMVKMFGDMFIIGFKIASPIIAAVFITDVALGILARTVPQMNVFVVGMPLKIVIGIGVLIITVAVFPIIMEVILNGMYKDLEAVLKDMVKQ
ncbi:flagellar biosynthetic protein FliR [Petroclostridium sp. X23]|uniref:flagellar biosynthetic protein FliR n=1 Tax=Petroclostridium sp. X23 TaxID=3045146 RepID=UPI0024AE39DF|nr:flagellar biosynthetic protein FliR [Petroclostridium sp. X23]WHH58950.1 flagellar biosynthetic protein FliR [Petroclostridium sp. X23]